MREPGELLNGVQLTLVDSTEEVANFLSWLGERRPLLGVDTETTGLSLSKDHIRMAQFGDAHHGWAIPYKNWRGLVEHVMTSYTGPRAYAHAKFEAGMFARDGIPFDWNGTHDVLPMAFLRDSLGPKNLKGAAARYVDPASRYGERYLKAAMAKHKWTWATVPEDFLPYWGYAALDTVLTAMLAEELWPGTQYFREAYDLEMACARILTGMELRGARIDVEYCAKQYRDLQWKYEQLQQELAPVNPMAPTQVAKALQAAGVTLTKLTRDGKLSVDDDVLDEVIRNEELPTTVRELAGTIREARYTDRLISAYFGNFLEQREDDILHPHINQLEARTGRMSVSEPALQQVPKNSFVRDAFIPREGNKLVLADYDNEELRVQAHFCGDENMIAAFEEGRDLHMEAAIRVWGPEDGPRKRSKGKRVMFSRTYGAGIAKIARSVGISEGDAQRVVDAINDIYPGLAKGMASATAVVRRRAAEDKSEAGYVVLTDGRHISVRAAKAYVGWNALIQGNCAVVLKRSIVDIDAAGLGELLVLPVHDENVLDVPEDDAEDVAHTVAKIMQRDDWRVPLTVTASVADRWGDPYRDEED